MKVIFFAQCRQVANCDETHLECARPLLVPELWDRLTQKFPALIPLQRTTRLARCEEYLSPEALLYPEDEIAIIPAVSGG